MVYNSVFDPIMQVGHTVTLRGSSFKEGGSSFKCIAVGGLPWKVKDFGALTATTWLNDQSNTDLEMQTRELGQYRMQVIDDIKLRLKNPTPVQQWRTRQTQFELPQFPPSGDPDWWKEYMFRISEFFCWEKDNKPAFDLYSVPTTTESRVAYTGYRFKMEPITGDGAFVLQVDGWPGVL